MKKLANALIWTAALVLAACVGVLLANGPLQGAFGKSGTTSRSTQIVQSVEKEQQVVLLSLGIQGIEEATTENKEIFGRITIPGSGSTKFILYRFDAKLGLEGSDVEIAEVGENSFKVTVPGFVFIGHDEVTFKAAAESNGPLSWISPGEDDLDIATTILNDENREKYLVEYREALESQAEAYYRQLVASIDPRAELSFEFEGK